MNKKQKIKRKKKNYTYNNEKKKNSHAENRPSLRMLAPRPLCNAAKDNVKSENFYT